MKEFSPSVSSGNSLEDLPAPTFTLATDLLGIFDKAQDKARDLRRSGRSAGPLTGFETLDKSLGGCLANGLHVLVAAPGSGKTAFCLQVATQSQCPVLFVTIEMAPQELLRRLLAQVTKTDLSRLRHGTLTKDELKQLYAQLRDDCPSIALFDVHAEIASKAKSSSLFEGIIQAANNLRNHFHSDHVLIVIDSASDLAHVLSAQQGLAEYEATQNTLNLLVDVSRSVKCPVVAIAHANRQALGTKEARGVGLSAAKGTGLFEYIAESVIGLSPNEETVSRGSAEKRIRLHLFKNRHGEIGHILDLMFKGAQQHFRLTGELEAR